MEMEFGLDLGLMEKRVYVRAWSNDPMTVCEAARRFAAANPFVNVGARDHPCTGQVQIGSRQVFILADYAD